MDFIAIGEIVIDFIPGREKHSYIRNAGGAPANVAISLARNGFSSGIYCKVGDDDFGRFLINTLKENHVKPLSPEPSREATTTMAFVSLTEQNERSFTFARKPGADMMLDKSEIRDEDLKECKILHTGSCILSSGKAVQATEYALRRARELGKMISFDINYRNLMWNNDEEACTKKVREQLPCVDLLKLSEEELDMVDGEKNIPHLMKENNIAVTVLTLGAEGARVFFRDDSRFLRGYRVDHVADTTGAGDAFWGGFLSRILELRVTRTDDLNMDILIDAVNYGNVSGCLAVRKKGAISSLPHKAQIEKFLRKNQSDI